ncbi:hypothetical protein BABINDRAFT_163794 [Babjeviella inositovora NRRL Y-12698]|uniref:Uncharacterized protein n=1 Tax=Babjeviella inositovora NRRL Y-12698 TaxID=984486 RepID=A0A1E3QH96_9ASCO|nr:uncharacterized protein BABINDRAFT_163794 [Babjeviella inositovora NRRL Y-12698]ODQ77061.1 hypothetical protein BABINDRAFT_163794 [Babjeviella inositovora NRRL Y-12698]
MSFRICLPVLGSPLELSEEEVEEKRVSQIIYQNDICLLEPQLSRVPVIKILFVGSADVGKSALLLQFSDSAFYASRHKSTVGVDMKVKLESVDGRMVKVILWDTAGQERYRALAPSIYHNTQGLILTYDITRLNTFEDLKDFWLSECLRHCQQKSQMVVFIVGNKKDLTLSEAGSRGSTRQVFKEDIQGLSKYIEALRLENDTETLFKVGGFYEVSANNKYQVDALMQRVLQAVVQTTGVFANPRVMVQGGGSQVSSKMEHKNSFN